MIYDLGFEICHPEFISGSVSTNKIVERDSDPAILRDRMTISR
jgi:hypothetical protein